MKILNEFLVDPIEFNFRVWQDHIQIWQNLNLKAYKIFPNFPQTIIFNSKKKEILQLHFTMSNQSCIAMRFLSNLSNIKLIEKINDDNFNNKFLFQDIVTKENYGVKIIPNGNENSSTICIYQIKETDSKNSIQKYDKLNIHIENNTKINKPCDSNNNTIIKYRKGHEFEGIFNYLNNKNKGLANFNGLLYISSNGDEKNHAFDLINNNFDDYFHPFPNENSYVKFDFKYQKVSLRNYSLKSKNIIYNKLINWEIEGSNDEINWDKIDERHIDIWSGIDNTATYSVNNHNFYQYVQIRLRGPSSSNDYLLCLTSIEFFGELR